VTLREDGEAASVAALNLAESCIFWLPSLDCGSLIYISTKLACFGPHFFHALIGFRKGETNEGSVDGCGSGRAVS